MSEEREDGWIMSFRFLAQLIALHHGVISRVDGAETVRALLIWLSIRCVVVLLGSLGDRLVVGDRICGFLGCHL